MAEATQQGDKINVFISYSRADLAFADQLDAALKLTGFNTSIDHAIPGGDEWEKRLVTLIGDADTIVFVLSPSSAPSKWCRWEVERAKERGKRILPVLCRPLDGVGPPPELAALQYIFFCDSKDSPRSGWGTGLAQLTAMLNTDLGWLREHTNYLRQASNWDEGGRPANRLLSGADIATGKAWIARHPKTAPQPTGLQLDFIKASEAEDIRQKSEVTRRQQEVADAQAAKEQALAERAEAQKREAKLSRRVFWLSLAGGATALCFAAAAGWFAIKASAAREEIQLQLNRVNRARAQSIINDLGLDRALEFEPRQREAVWRLAVADEPVKHDFVSILINNPEDLIRVSPGFAQISRALGLLRPTPTEGETLIAALVRELRTTDEQRNARYLETEIGALVAVLRASPAKLTDAQAVQALDAAPSLDAFRALAPELTEAQAGRALDLVLKQFSQATNPNALGALAEALQALAPKLAEAEAVQALTIVLKQISQTTNPAEFGGLGRASQALAPKLSEPQSSQALDPVLKQIAQTTSPYALWALAQTLRALPVKLTEEQAGQAIKPVLKQIGPTTDHGAAQALAQAIQALAPKLSEAQAGQAIDAVLKQLGQTTDPYVLLALAKALEALPARPTQEQASQALKAVLNQIGETSEPVALMALAKVLKALPAKLTDEQASQALKGVLDRIGQTLQAQASAAKRTEGLLGQGQDFQVALRALAEALQALAAKLTEAQASQALDSVLKQIDNATNSYAPEALGPPLEALGPALQALAAKLTEAEATEAFKSVFNQMSQTTNVYALEAPAETLRALATKLTEAQAGQAFEPVLKQVGRIKHAETLAALAQTLQNLAAKLTEPQASQALESVLKKIRETTDSAALSALARALQALAAKLSAAQATQASTAAVSSLAWAANSREAAEWARALVALSHSVADHERTLVTVIGYPAAVRSATDVLLDAIRAEHPDAPTKEAGTESDLAWLAKNFPDVLHPVCPEPLQADLKCPPQEADPAGQ